MVTTDVGDPMAALLLVVLFLSGLYTLLALLALLVECAERRAPFKRRNKHERL